MRPRCNVILPNGELCNAELDEHGMHSVEPLARRWLARRCPSCQQDTAFPEAALWKALELHCSKCLSVIWREGVPA